MMLPLNLAFLSGDLGSGEILLICVVVLVFLGPRRLPEIARTIGRVMNDLRRASRDFQDQIMQIDVEPPPSVPPYRALPEADDSPCEPDGSTFANVAPPGEFPAAADSGTPPEAGAQADAGVLDSSATVEPAADEKKPEEAHGTAG
jgi:sec-independent protein translocase protein TatA